MEKLNFEDLKEGLNFVFLGDADHYQSIFQQFEHMTNVYFASSMDHRNLTDKYIDDISLVVVNNDLDVKILDVVNFPDLNLNWETTLKIYIDNYNNPEDYNKLYKWGQIAMADIEILCSNCGYITSIKAGETYPICEACHSGLPDSPTEPDVAFWTNL
jgi:hypothetical protein